MNAPEKDDDRPVAEFIALQSPRQKLRLVCTWTLTCYRRGETVAVHVADEEQANRLDNLLWTFQDMSFLPHVIARQAQDPILEPVLIYFADEPVQQADVLFEAAGSGVIDDFEHFAHIYDFAEVYDEALRQTSRERFSTYKGSGYRMRYIEQE